MEYEMGVEGDHGTGHKNFSWFSDYLEGVDKTGMQTQETSFICQINSSEDLT